MNEDVNPSSSGAREGNSPTVSVIVPAYNAVSYVPQCLDSLLSQSFKDIEIICIDDGSTDETLDLLRAYEQKDPRVSVLKQNNAGPGVARNNGIDAARGDYLYFLDADDFCHPDFLEKALQTAKETDADVVVCRFNLYNQNVKVEISPAWTLRSDLYPQEAFDWTANPLDLFGTFHNYPWNKLCKTEFIRQNDIRFQEIYLTEDFLFSAKALVLAKRIACLNEPLVTHREGTQSNIMASKHRHPFDFIEGFSTTRQFLIDKGCYDQLRASFVPWAVNACRYNLLTIRNRHSFHDILIELQDSGLRRLDLLDDSLDLMSEEDKHFIELIWTGQEEQLLFEEYAKLRVEDDNRINQIQAVELQLTHLHAMEAELEAERRRLSETREQLEFNFNELADRHQSVLNCAEMKIGRFFCAFPRFIQRQILKRRQG